MPESKWQSETGIAINDKSQGNVDRRLRYCEIFSCHFTVNLLSSLAVKES